MFINLSLYQTSTKSLSKCAAKDTAAHADGDTDLDADFCMEVFAHADGDAGFCITTKIDHWIPGIGIGISVVRTAAGLFFRTTSSFTFMFSMLFLKKAKFAIKV